MKKFTSVLFICFFALSACSKDTSDHSSWLGTYIYEADSGETVSGDKAVVAYNLKLETGKCLLQTEGYQTDETIICEQVMRGNKVIINFVSYNGGSKTNAYGVEIYHSNEILFALQKREEKIETEWHALKPVETASDTCQCFAKKSQ